MSGGKKKKSAAKRNTVSKPARFTVAPLSPVRTRSKGGKSKSAQVNNAPEVATPIMTPAPAEVIVPVETASSVTDLEKPFGDRMSQMETDLPFVPIWSGLSRFLALVPSPDPGQYLSQFLLCVPIFRFRFLLCVPIFGHP